MDLFHPSKRPYSKPITPIKDYRALRSDIKVIDAVRTVDLGVIILKIGEVRDKRRWLAPYLPRNRLIREL
jgi:hypothetical protein